MKIILFKNVNLLFFIILLVIFQVFFTNFYTNAKNISRQKKSNSNISTIDNKSLEKQWSFKSVQLKYDKRNKILDIRTNVTNKNSSLKYNFYWRETLKNRSGKINNPCNLSDIKWLIPEYGNYIISVEVSDNSNIKKKIDKSIGVIDQSVCIQGVDVSCWQRQIDWDKVKDNSKIKFAMIRTGFGRNEPKQKDSWFDTNYENAKKANIDVGAYHYSYAKTVQDALNEAEFCLSIINNRQLEYPVAFDIEDPSQYKVNRRTLTNICKAFCERIRQAGYMPMIYSNKMFIENHLYAKELFPKYDLWFSNWNSYPCLYCQMWQYTDKGRIKGINNGVKIVDLNYCYKDYPKYMKEHHLNKY